MSGAVRAEDGRRLHLQHGPIDLIIEAWGRPDAIATAYEAAWERFRPLLDELVAELETLRTPLPSSGDVAGPVRIQGPVARRMLIAVAPYADRFVTPMAAVAGAVADEVRDAMVAAADLRRAYVNDGGDIALHLTPGETLAVGMVPVPGRPALVGKATIGADDPVRGVATSGRHGRSLSFGIADAVTVLATSAAAADVAATMVANEVDLPGHPAVRRVPADEIEHDTDLGSRPVTAAVGPLRVDEVDAALAAGRAEAERLHRAGLIAGAVLCLDGRLATVASPVLASADEG